LVNYRDKHTEMHGQ